jgi:hypothetical protein
MFGDLSTVLAFGLASLGVQIVAIDSNGPIPYSLNRSESAEAPASVVDAPFSPRAPLAEVVGEAVLRAWPGHVRVTLDTFFRPTQLAAPWVRLRLQPPNTITQCVARLSSIEGSDGSFWIGAEFGNFYELTETERMIIEAREEALGWRIPDGLEMQATCGQVISAFLRERFSLILHEEIREGLFPRDRREKIREIWIRILPGSSGMEPNVTSVSVSR